MKITKCKGSFLWDTSEYGTDVKDITDFLAACLNSATRREYRIRLDLTAIGEDGAFDRLYLSVKDKVNPASFAASERRTVLKDEIIEAAEPVIILTIPPTVDALQITIEMKTALSEDATIYFSVARGHLE